MTLTNIEYGSLASSEIMNNNFRYLDNKIADLDNSIKSDYAGLNSNLASINNAITKNQDDNLQEFNNIKTNIENTNTIFSEIGAYTKTYRNGNSWYREYFSDKEKKNRIWLEEGGICNSNSSTTYIKAFKSTNYTLILGSYCTYFESGGISEKSKTGFSHYNGKGWNYSVEWYACGE